MVIPSTDTSLSRSWLRSSWNFKFPNIKDAVKVWTNRIWSICNWCQNCIAQVWVWHTCFQQYRMCVCVFTYVCTQLSTALRLSSDKMTWGHVCLCFYKTYIKTLSYPFFLSLSSYCSSESGLCVFELQSLEVLKDNIFPSRFCHRELHSLKQRFCILESELHKLQEALKVGIVK